MDTVNKILTKFNLKFDDSVRMPIEITNFGRDQLADLFRELGFNIGVEVGVLAGEYSEILLRANPNLKLYGVDPWIPHKGYRDYTRKETLNSKLEEAHLRLDGLNFTFIQKYSMDAVKDFKDETIDFVYIDGDHSFQSVTNDIAEWTWKVKKGGIIAGHDYSKHDNVYTNCHVYQVVNAYTDAIRLRPWFVLGSKEFKPGVIRDKARSWMIVKL